MFLKSAFVFSFAALLAGGSAMAADVPADTQKALYDIYTLNCTAAMDPSDKNFDASAAYLSPDFVSIDLKGTQRKRDEVIAMGKQQLKMFHATSCDNKFESIASSDPSTVVIVNTSKISGDVQAPDGKHEFDATNKAQDTWKLVNGKWLETQSKDLRVLVKVDGNVVQDQGQ